MKSSTTRALVAKKQSTSFTQVATNLLNVLQGYSKTIRLLLVMFVALSVSATAWGETVTISVSDFTQCTASEITQSVKGFTFYCGNGLIDSESFRSYSGQIFRITSNVGSMSEIEFTFTSSSANRSWGQNATTYIVYPNADTWEITGPNQARITQIVITYETIAASCDEKVSLTKGAETNGTFTLDKADGTYETCNAQLVITLSNITPSAGYQFGAITQTGIGTGVTIDQANKTVTYAKNTSGTSTINVTFEQKQSATITLSEAGVETHVTGKYVGDPYTLPSTTSQSCGTKTLVGWSTVQVAGTDTKPTSNYYELGEQVTLTATQTFYAVFANVETTPGETTTEWVETEIEDIASTDEVVVAMTLSDGTTRALNSSNGTSSAPIASPITAEEFAKNQVINDLIWNISKEGNNLTFCPKGNTTTWLYCSTNATSGSNNNMRVGSGNRKVFVLDDGALKTNDTYTTRYVSLYYQSSGLYYDVRGYTSKSSGILFIPVFYKKTTTSTSTETITNYTTQCSTQPSHTVTSNLSHVMVDPANPTRVLESAEDLTLAYLPEDGWNLPATISVTMGGTPLSSETDYDWDNGDLLIAPASGFTGDIVVTINGWQQLATPTGLNVTNITSTSATLSWGEVANASSYLVTIVDGGDLSADIPNTQTSHTFEGLTPSTEYLWTVKAIGDGITYTNSEESETGEFTTSPATCTVTYDANGGEGTIIDNTEYTNGATVTVLGNFGKLTKDGYAFTGWTDGSGNSYKHNDKFTITTNTTLYAQWCKAYWKLVTDAAELENDTRIVIAAKDYNFALSTTQATSNRGQAEITKKYNTITFGADVQTLSAVGPVNNNFALYSPGPLSIGYLYAASNSANQLKTKTTLDNNCYWSIGISETVASIYAQGDNSHNQIKYNHQQSGQLFSCYESSNTTMSAVAIYKEVCVQDQYNVNEPNLTNTTADNNNPTTVASNATSLTLNYSANAGYLLPETITVKMGGALLVATTDYTWDKATGTLTINVTGFYGDIDVKIVAEEDPCYGFAMSAVTATSTTNSITLTWSVVNGATGYNVKIGTGDFVAANGLTHTFTDLNANTPYNWEVQAVKDGDGFHCEASKTGTTTTQKETFTVSWSVNGNVTSTESVVDGEKIKNYPSDPSAPSGCSTKVFVGWTKQPIPTETNETPTLYTELKDIPAITANTPLYAVWADVEGGSGNGEEEKKVTLDFTSNSSWKFPTSKTTTSSTYTDANGISITLGGVTSNGWAWYDNGDYFLYGQSGCYIQFPAFDFTVTKFVTKGRTDASSKVTQNVFVEDEAVSIQTTGTTGENTYEIASEYQEAGNVYLLKVTSAHNAQVTQIDIYGITSSITTAYTTLCDECTPSESLVLAANASTADLDINGEATITFSTTGGNGGEITYAASPYAGVTWENGTATFTKAGDYTITASQEENGEYCPTTSNTVNVTITAIPHLYFVTEPANPIVFDPVECGGNTRLDDKKSVSVQAYNLAAAVTAQVAGPYKIARTSGATLNEYTTSLTLRNNITDGKINGDDDVIYILSFPPAGSDEPTEGTLTFTTTNGNTLTINLSTPKINCTPRTLTFNDRGITTTEKYYAGTEVPEPATPTGVCGEYEFDGWALAKVESGSTTYAKVEFPYIMPANNQTVLHAVYRYTEGPTNQYELVTEIESGKDYVIAAYDEPNGDFALTNQESNTDGKFNSELVECDANNIITTDNSNIIWTVTGNDEDGYEFYNSAVQKYIEMYRYDGKSLLRLVDNCTNTFDVNIEMDENDKVYVDITSPEVDATYNVFSFYEQLFNVYKSCDYNIYFYEQTATSLYTTTPDCHPSVTLTSDGEVYVTATNGRGIMAATPLTLTTTDLAPNTEIAISSNSSDIYFSTERNTNFAMAQASQPKTSLTLTTNEGGELETPLYIHYKPSADGDGTPAEVVVTADVSTHNPPFTAQKTIHVRNLPAKFVIATKVGATWYALPANMSEATNPEGVLIEVDEASMTATAPNTASYTLFPVKTTNGEYDRYATNTTHYEGNAYGDRVRFAAVNNNKGLWANNSENGNTIRNNAAISSVSDGGTTSNTNPSYEWIITTSVVDGNWQYTLQTDQDKNQQYLRYWVGATGAPKWGTYAAGNNQLYFLPVTETEPFDYKVVEWYPTKMLIQTDATIANPTAEIGDAPINNVTCTNKGSKLYEIAGLPLESNPTKVLTIKFSDGGNNYTNATAIPVIISQSATTVSSAPFTTLTKDVYNYADLVVRDGATLTVDGAANTDNTFYNVTIYPTAKIVVPSDKKITVYSLTFFGGIDDIYDGEKYTTNKYGVPQLSLKGTLGKTVTTMDYIMRVNLDQMYQVGVPYDVALADIKYWDGSVIKPGTQLYVSAYDGQARANLDMSNTWRWEVNFDEKVLKAGVGYTISAEPQVENDTYSILRMPMKSNISSGFSEEAKTINVVAYDNQKGVTITDNHKGWNYLSNPYMTTISGGEADTKLVLGSLKETGTGPWEWVETTQRYVTIPMDNGKDYYQKKFSEAELKPFKSFFVQIAQGGELSFALASRQNAPARLLQQQTTSSEIEFELLLSNGKQSDNTGLLISEEYTPAYEINADLEKMTGAMSVYTIYNGYNLAYNALSPINAQEQIPIGYVVPDVGEYTFKLDENADVENIEHIYLNDFDMNVVTDLLEDEYTFYASEKKSEARFVINVIMRSEQEDDTPTGLEELEINTNHPTKFIHQDRLYILRDGVIYDATGQEIQTINK